MDNVLFYKAQRLPHADFHDGPLDLSTHSNARMRHSGTVMAWLSKAPRSASSASRSHRAKCIYGLGNARLRKRAYYPKLQRIRIPNPPNEVQRCPEALNYTRWSLDGHEGSVVSNGMQRDLLRDSSNLHDGSTAHYTGSTEYFYHHFHYYMNESGHCFSI